MKAFLGEPIGTFIVRTRTEAAARLLRYSSTSISDIAYRIGYLLHRLFPKYSNKCMVSLQQNIVIIKTM